MRERKIKPEKAQQILSKNGKNVSLDQARQILDVLYKFANIALTSIKP